MARRVQVSPGMRTALWILVAIAAPSLAQPVAEVSSDTWFRDPNVTRHFYAPTGFMLRQGEGYVSQKELLFSSFGYGVTDHFTLTVASVVPGWGFNNPNVLGGVKLGMDVNDMVHLSASAQGLYIPRFDGSSHNLTGMALGTLTYGTPRLNATVSLGGHLGGWLAPGGSGLNGQGLVAMVGGQWRLTPNVALQTEHWFLPQVSMAFLASEPFLMLNSAGVRLMNDRWAVDLGVVRVPGAGFPVPWVDITYSFGS